MKNRYFIYTNGGTGIIVLALKTVSSVTREVLCLNGKHLFQQISQILGQVRLKVQVCKISTWKKGWEIRISMLGPATWKPVLPK